VPISSGCWGGSGILHFIPEGHWMPPTPPHIGAGVALELGDGFGVDDVAVTLGSGALGLEVMVVVGCAEVGCEEVLVEFSDAHAAAPRVATTTRNERGRIMPSPYSDPREVGSERNPAASMAPDDPGGVPVALGSRFTRHIGCNLLGRGEPWKS
jgi:hypothetical protein